MSILELLDDCSDTPLLASGGNQWSKAEFVGLVCEYVKQLEGVPAGEGYILVAEQEPVKFYGLIFALWKLGRRVLFPNPDILKNPSCFPHFEYSVSVLDEKPEWFVNTGYRSVPRLEEATEGDIIVFSSGSTGQPKGVVHNKESFLVNAKATMMLLDNLQGTSAIFLKPYLVSAFSHFLVHFLKGAMLSFHDMDNMAELTEHYCEDPNLSLVGSPMHIISARKHIPDSAEPRMFMSSGDFIYPSIIQRLIQDFPKTVYYYVYGLAELGGRFFVNRIDTDTDISRYGCLGCNLPVTEYRIIERELEVRSECQFFGYIIDGEYISVGSFHPSSDLVEQRNECLKLVGRQGDELKIAGNKVSLKLLEQKVSMAFPDDVPLFVPTRHDVLGTLIAMVLQSNKRYERKEVLSSLRQVLEVHEMPHYLYMIDSIPYTQSMKIDRKYISEHLSDLDPIQ